MCYILVDINVDSDSSAEEETASAGNEQGQRLNFDQGC